MIWHAYPRWKAIPIICTPFFIVTIWYSGLVYFYDLAKSSASLVASHVLKMKSIKQLHILRWLTSNLSVTCLELKFPRQYIILYRHSGKNIKIYFMICPVWYCLPSENNDVFNDQITQFSQSLGLRLAFNFPGSCYIRPVILSFTFFISTTKWDVVEEKNSFFILQVYVFPPLYPRILQNTLVRFPKNYKCDKKKRKRACFLMRCFTFKMNPTRLIWSKIVRAGKLA